MFIGYRMRASRSRGRAVPTWLDDQVGAVCLSLRREGQVWVNTSVWFDGSKIAHSILLVYVPQRRLLIYCDINGVQYRRDTAKVRWGAIRTLLATVRRELDVLHVRTLVELRPDLHTDMVALASSRTSDPSGGCGQYVEAVSQLRLNADPPNWVR